MTSPERLVDLHVHTTTSDGQFTPDEVVRAAKAAGLAAIAVTDHDTLAGLDEALDAGRREGFEVVPGLEISVEYPGSTMHILAYEIDHRDPALAEALDGFRRHRDDRNHRILERLAELGIPLTWDAVLAQVKGETVGRPHIALAMVEAGYAPSTDQVFRRYLARGAPAHVERRRATPAEAVALIRDAGGLAVLAHPKHLNRPTADIRQIVTELSELGIEGLEVYHPDHSTDDMRTFKVMAEQLDLVATGGTDFHGHLRKGVQLGVGYGNLRIPYAVVEQLRARIAARTAVEPPGPTR